MPLYNVITIFIRNDIRHSNLFQFLIFIALPNYCNSIKIFIIVKVYY